MLNGNEALFDAKVTACSPGNLSWAQLCSAFVTGHAVVVVTLPCLSIEPLASPSQHLQEQALILTLIQAGQEHLFNTWPSPGTGDSDKKRLVEQLKALDASYHGGITAYISNAKKLLQDSKEGGCGVVVGGSRVGWRHQGGHDGNEGNAVTSCLLHS